MTQITVQGFDLVQTDKVDDKVDDKPSRFESLSRPFARPVQSLRAVPHLGIWLGMTVAAAGAVLLVIAWVRTAALTDVSLQIPYVVSAGFTGLGLIAVGLTFVSIATKRADSSERIRQAGELRALLSELRAVVEKDRIQNTEQDQT